jgi:hypothetical protein
MNRSARVSQRVRWRENGCRAVGRLSRDGKLKVPGAACRGDVAEVDPCLGVRAYLVTAVDPGGSSRGLGVDEPGLDRSAGVVARLPVRQPADDCDNADYCEGYRQQPANDASGGWRGSWHRWDPTSRLRWDQPVATPIPVAITWALSLVTRTSSLSIVAASSRPVPICTRLLGGEESVENGACRVPPIGIDVRG